MNINAFKQHLSKPSVPIRYKFLYDGTDRTDMLVKDGTSMIRRDMNLSVGKAMIKLSNATGWFNFLHQNGDALGDDVELQLYISGEESNAYTICKGTVRWPIWEGAIVTLQIKDRNSYFLDRKVGSSSSPYTYWAFQTWNADEVIWRLLTVIGGLSGISGPDNPDIDYASFARCRDQHLRANGYAIKGLPKAQTVGQCLMIICQMTHIYIWVNNQNKVAFAPPHDAGGLYDQHNTGEEGSAGDGINLEMPDDRIINDVIVRYGYNTDIGSWLNSVREKDAASIAKYGRYPSEVANHTFWHMTPTSAAADAVATIRDYKYPLRLFSIVGGFEALAEDLGKWIYINDSVKDIAYAKSYIEKIEYNLDTWETNIEARWPW